MKKRNILLMALALVLVLSMSIGPAFAYFTTTVTAAGSVTLTLPAVTTDIEEPSVAEWVKHVVVTNDETSSPVFIRARAYAGDAYTLSYSGDNWTADTDGWYYYSPVVEPGSQTNELLVQIGGVPADAAEGDSFNVVVVYEATPVQYDAAGNATPDWTITLSEGGNGNAE